jgi:hypothetical protein
MFWHAQSLFILEMVSITVIQIDVLAEAPRAKQGDFIRAAVSAKTAVRSRGC